MLLLFHCSSTYASTDFDTYPREQLSAHEVLCPGCYSHDLSNRDILLQKALFLSQFLRLFMIIDGVFLVLWALLAWPFFIGLLLIIMGFYGVKYYNTMLSSMVYRTAHCSSHTTIMLAAVQILKTAASRLFAVCSTGCTCWPTWLCASGG